MTQLQMKQYKEFIDCKTPVKKIGDAIDDLIEVSTYFYATRKPKKAEKLDEIIDELIDYSQ